MVNMFTISQPSTETVEQPYSSVTLQSHMDFSKFTSGDGVPVVYNEPPQSVEEPKKKRKPRQNTQANVITDTFDDNTSTRELTMLESNEPYDSKYQETNNMLRTAIAQIDICMGEVHDDIQVIRSSKAMKSKYNYLSLMHGAMNGLIGNKITAARELNNTISKCADLELKRYKEVRSAAAAAEQDDNQRIQDMYKAFISTPVGNRGGSVLGPTVADMSVASASLVGTQIGSVDQQYANYMANLTPAQNMMLLESNPNIKQVVVYNQETGARYFDVIDMTTGESVPNTEKHDSMFLEDVTLNLKDKIATNTNLGETYPLIIVGQPILNEY